MSLKGVVQWSFGVIILAAIAAFLVWVYVERHNESSKDTEEKEGEKEASHVSVEGGESVVTLTNDIQSKCRMAAVSLAKTSHQVHERACVCPDFAPVRAVFWPKVGIVRRGWMKEQDNG